MLLTYSLVESHLNIESYSIHPMIHDLCVKFISKDKHDLMMLALTVVGYAVSTSSEPEY
jgi:hypothetical protein